MRLAAEQVLIRCVTFESLESLEFFSAPLALALLSLILGEIMGRWGRFSKTNVGVLFVWVLAALELQACSQRQFGFSQSRAQQNFDMVSAQLTTTQFAPRADILWVVDSSGSMGPFQTKLQNAFQHFSTTYLQQSSAFGQWDIRMAAIEIDAYIAGLTIAQATALEGMPSQYPETVSVPISSATVYAMDVPALLGQSSIPSTMLLNTLPPLGVAADSQWWSALQWGFNTVTNKGSNGSGVESATASIRKLLQNHESTAYCSPDATSGLVPNDCLFRSGTTHVYVIVSDEENNLCVNRTLATPTDQYPNYYQTPCIGGLDENALTKQAIEDLYDAKNPGSTERRYFTVSINDEDYANSSITDPSLRRQAQPGLGPAFYPGDASHHAWVDLVTTGSTANGKTNVAAPYSEVRNIFDIDFDGIMEKLGNSIISTSSSIINVYTFQLNYNPVPGTTQVVLVAKDGSQQYTLDSSQYLIQGSLLQLIESSLPTSVIPAFYQVQINYTPSPI